MHRSIAKLAFLLAAAAVSCGFFTVAHATCWPRERDALLAFKQGIKDTSGVLASWQERRQDCCSWTGVTCSNETGHVTGLQIGGMSLVGQISPSLLSLEHLEYLDISSTSLLEPNGRVLPEFLCSLHNLRHLDIQDTPFSGRLPSQLANLSKLEYLNLSWTSLFGALPHQLANLSKLEYLYLSDTLLSGALPPQLGNLSNLRQLGLGFMPNIHTSDISWLTNLHLLEYVDMSDMNLSTTDVFSVANTIPSLKILYLTNYSLPNANQTLTHLNLTKLEELDLSTNYLGHPIETCWFWNITSITDLLLGSTYLYGPFPDALGGMTSLQTLDFSNNGNSATMTVDLKNLCDLESLSLDGSLALGNITEFVRNLPQCSSSKLSFLSSSDNNMTGILPDMVAHLNSLKYILLTNNSITGAIPSGLRNLTSLDSLNLSFNQLTGQIPMLPRSLVLLDLSNNRFEGEFPWWSAMPSMKFLLLSNNNFSGKFPSWLKRCSSLVFLDLGVNKFYGMLPTWVGELVTLRFLQLNHNMFYGDIPVSITNLKLLQHFSLASNNMSGSLPSSLSKLIAMTLEHPPRLEYGDWNAAGEIQRDVLSVVMKQQELKYGTSAVNEMVGIDLSINRLTGGIPDEIASLNGMLNLNLSWNHLSGKIPVKIGDMKSLESLDFSRNNLSGEIPASLSDLTYLSSLDLSYDNLVGRIPTGRQLDTLYTENPSIYNGNSGLCGLPLKKNCTGANNAQEHGNQQRSENGYDPVFFYFGLTAGFVVGLWVVLCALLFKRAWRNAYFRVFDKLYDNVHVFAVLTWVRITRKATTT